VIYILPLSSIFGTLVGSTGETTTKRKKRIGFSSFSKNIRKRENNQKEKDTKNKKKKKNEKKATKNEQNNICVSQRRGGRITFVHTVLVRPHTYFSFK